MIDKEKTENAIKDINSLIMDFGDAVETLIKIKELLYSFIEEPEDNKNEN